MKNWNPRKWLALLQYELVLTVEVVDLEEEGDLLVLALAGELVHRLDKLGQRDRPASVFVEYSKWSFDKKFLKPMRNVILYYCILYRFIFNFWIDLFWIYFLCTCNNITFCANWSQVIIFRLQFLFKAEKANGNRTPPLTLPLQDS